MQRLRALAGHLAPAPAAGASSLLTDIEGKAQPIEDIVVVREHPHKDATVAEKIDHFHE